MNEFLITLAGLGTIVGFFTGMLAGRSLGWWQRLRRRPTADAELTHTHARAGGMDVVSNFRKVTVRAIRIAEVADVEVEVPERVVGMDTEEDAARRVREMILRGEVAMHPPKRDLYVFPRGERWPEGVLE